MINTVTELKQRLDKVEKCNLCDENTTLSQLNDFCLDFMKVVADCNVSPEEGATIFQEYLTDCFESYDKVPKKFLMSDAKFITEVAKQKTPDYAITTVRNLATGDELNYYYTVVHFADLNKKWLNAQVKEDTLEM